MPIDKSLRTVGEDQQTVKDFTSDAVDLALEQSKIDRSVLSDTDRVVNYIVSIDLWGKNHHYIATFVTNFYSHGTFKEWEFEYYDKDDNEPTDCIEDVKIDGLSDFKELVRKHLNGVLNG